MLAEVEASRMSTAELEMQTAPAVAAAIGGIVLTGMSAVLPARHDGACHDQNALW
jgi:hypothetical protein